MATPTSTNNYFNDAHKHRRDITESYLALGDVPTLVGVSTQNEAAILQAVRSLLTQGGGISAISELGKPLRHQARELYEEDRIVAIDGTDAISPLRFVSDTVYASGVVAVTPRSRHQPRTRVTRTRASSYASTQDLTGTWEDNIRAWGEYLRGAREGELSWVNTFREYEERELALDVLDTDHKELALIDGPLLTQNLLSQRTARELLARLIASGKVVGFIKELSANPLLMAIGCSLRPGEAFVLSHWSRLLRERFRRGQQAISSWVEHHAGHVVRAIYKTSRKAYGLECAMDSIPLAFAVLEHDRGGPVDHDIPLLLQIADSHVRSRFRGASARDEVLARYSLSDPERFLELTHERNLR